MIIPRAESLIRRKCIRIPCTHEIYGSTSKFCSAIEIRDCVINFHDQFTAFEIPHSIFVSNNSTKISRAQRTKSTDPSQLPNRGNIMAINRQTDTSVQLSLETIALGSFYFILYVFFLFYPLFSVTKK